MGGSWTCAQAMLDLNNCKKIMMTKKNEDGVFYFFNKLSCHCFRSIPYLSCHLVLALTKCLVDCGKSEIPCNEYQTEFILYKSIVGRQECKD